MLEVMCYELQRYDVCVSSAQNQPKIYTFYDEDKALDFAYKAGTNLIYFERVQRAVLNN